MLFPQLDKYKGDDPELDDILFKLKEYLNRKLGEIAVSRNPLLSVRVNQFASDFLLSREDALLAFDLCADEIILLTEYHFYCPETENFIAKFTSLKETPKVLPCGYHFHTEEHKTVDCPVEILFKFSPQILNRSEESAV